MCEQTCIGVGIMGMKRPAPESLQISPSSAEVKTTAIPVLYDKLSWRGDGQVCR